MPTKGEVTLTYVTHPLCKRMKVRKFHAEVSRLNAGQSLTPSQSCLISEVLEMRNADDPLGQAEVDLSMLYPGLELRDIWAPLEGVATGKVCLHAKVEDDVRGKGVLDSGAEMLVTVTLVCGRDLVAMDASGTSDPYCVLTIGDSTFKCELEGGIH